MSKLLKAFEKNPLTLIVDLPENSQEFTKAAIDSGADALVARISGSIKGEKKVIKKILDVADIPVGVAFQGEVKESDIKDIKTMGADFFIVPLEEIPAWMLKVKGIARVASINPSYSVDRLIGLSKLRIEALEASIIPKSHYGKDLTVGDLQRYITVCISANVPVIISTECAIRVSEAAIIWDTGAKGIQINEIVTGKTTKSLKKAVNEFRIAIDDIGG